MKRRMMRGSWPPHLWGQLKIITAMLILNLVFNFAICTDMMMKKPIQSDINVPGHYDQDCDERFC